MPPKRITLDLTPQKRKAPEIGAIKATPPMSFLLMTATLGGYYAAVFRMYPGNVREELQKTVGGEDAFSQLRYTYGLQKAMMPNDKNSYVLFWEDDMSDNEEGKEPKDFVLLLLMMLQEKGIDGTKGFKICTDIPLAKAVCDDYQYHLTDMPLAGEKNKIEGIVRERWTIKIEFTVIDDDIAIVLSNAWRFRQRRMEPLSLTLVRKSSLTQIDAPETPVVGEQKDLWVHNGTIKKDEFQQWTRDAKELFGTMPVHFQLHIPDETDEADVKSWLKATRWTGYGADA